MANLKALLAKRLSNARRIALLGVGSELRGDDACGVLVADAVKKSVKSAPKRKFKVFSGCTAPENMTGVIRRFNPTHVVIVDAADLGAKPGAVKLIDPDKIRGTSFCTHQLPLSILADYLVQSIGCELLVIGIQPKDLTFGRPLSREIKKSVKDVSGAFADVLRS